MRKLAYIIIAVLVFASFSKSAFSAWVWTPETKKFINPKYAVKDTPKEQFDWANSYLEKKQYEKAVFEFEKLIKNYPHSEFAPKAQYYIGRTYEDMGDPYRAFLNYQKVIDNYPYNNRVEEIIEREYKIGNLFFSGQKSRILGMDILPGLDKSVEIFRKVVANAPYGEYADLAQFKLGEACKKLKNFNEAIVEFQKLVETYPSSKLADDARYEIAQCAYNASLGADYDQETTDKAITEFKSFAENHPESELAKDVDKTLGNLNEKKAGSAFKTAEFYKRVNKLTSARIYYEEILNNYPNTSFAKDARKAIDAIDAKLSPKSKKRIAEKKVEKAPPAELKKEAAEEVAKKIEPELAPAPEAPKEEVKAIPAAKEEAPKAISEAPKEAAIEKKVEVPAAPVEAKKEEKVKAAKVEEPVKTPRRRQGINILGYTTGNLLPDSINTIYIDNFVNKIDVTQEITNVDQYRIYRSGLESDITNAVLDGFRRDGSLLIVPKGQGDLRLYGDLIKLGREPLRYDSNDNITEYRIYIIANLVMKNSKDEELWKESNFTGEATYTTTGPLARSEDSAIDDAIQDFQQRVIERTIEDW